MIFQEIMDNLSTYLLFEGVSNDEINNAINNHKYVVITYEGTDGTHNQNRMIQPVAFGLTSSGHPVVRAYENFGDTKTAVPRWKYLRVDRISSWRETDKTFNEPAALFNPNDDRTMSVVYNIAKFDDENNDISNTPSSSPKKKSEEKPNVYKTDTERKLEKLRKQLANPITFSDFKTQNAFGNSSNVQQTSGPKKNKDVKKGTDDIYNDEYNYNVFDNALYAAGRRTKRNGNYYFQKRDKFGKFTNGNVLDDDPMSDDSKETEEYLNKDNGNNDALEDFRRRIGDTSKPISLRDLQDRLRRK